MILLSGILSSFIATIIYALFAYSMRPKIEISEKLCVTESDNHNTTYIIKVVNKTKYRIIDIKYNLDICTKGQDDITYINEVPALKTPLTTIAAYNNEDHDYAVRITFDGNKNLYALSNGDYLEFTIQATHPFSGHSSFVSKKYRSSDLAHNCKFGIGVDMNVIELSSGPPNRGTSVHVTQGVLP